MSQPAQSEPLLLLCKVSWRSKSQKSLGGSAAIGTERHDCHMTGEVQSSWLFHTSSGHAYEYKNSGLILSVALGARHKLPKAKD